MNQIGYSRYDDPTYFDHEEEYVHVDSLHEMKETMKTILNIIYSDRDVEDLEYEIENLARCFDMKLPPRAFTLGRTKRSER